jgi:hypothetical protein
LHNKNKKRQQIAKVTERGKNGWDRTSRC